MESSNPPDRVGGVSNVGGAGPDQTSPDPASNIHNDIDALKKQLAEQKQATRRAVKSATELETRLTSAQTEIEEIKSQSQDFATGPMSARARKADETEKMRSQWQIMQVELENEKRARTAEAERAAARLAALKTELQATQAAIEAPASASGTPKSRATRRAIAAAAAAVVAMIGISLFIWSMVGAPGDKAPPIAAKQDQAKQDQARHDQARHDETKQDRVEPLIPEPPGKPKPGPVIGTQTLPPEAVRGANHPAGESSGPPKASKAEFTMALDRLQHALGASAVGEEKLREAIKSQPGCQLAWSDGRPILLFGGDRKNPNSMAGTLSKCAATVEQLH